MVVDEDALFSTTIASGHGLDNANALTLCVRGGGAVAWNDSSAASIESSSLQTWKLTCDQFSRLLMHSLMHQMLGMGTLFRNVSPPPWWCSPTVDGRTASVLIFSHDVNVESILMMMYNLDLLYNTAKSHYYPSETHFLLTPCAHTLFSKDYHD